jgi:hypothetical protein
MGSRYSWSTIWGAAQAGSLREDKASRKGVILEMVRVAIEVGCGVARFRVGIQSSSIQRAVSLAQNLYSASDVRVIFPIDPEDFVVEDVLAKEGLIEGGKPQKEQDELAA